MRMRRMRRMMMRRMLHTICHVPYMNLQMCAHLGNLSESERRSEICQLGPEAVV